MNRIKIKFDTKLKPTKHIVVNYNFTTSRKTTTNSEAKVIKMRLTDEVDGF